jgi:hypothetical protein
MTTEQLNQGSYLDYRIALLRNLEKDLKEGHIFLVIRSLKSNDLLEKQLEEEIKKLLLESINKLIENNIKEFDAL